MDALGLADERMCLLEQAAALLDEAGDERFLSALDDLDPGAGAGSDASGVRRAEGLPLWGLPVQPLAIVYLEAEIARAHQRAYSSWTATGGLSGKHPIHPFLVDACEAMERAVLEALALASGASASQAAIVAVVGPTWTGTWPALLDGVHRIEFTGPETVPGYGN